MELKSTQKGLVLNNVDDVVIQICDEDAENQAGMAMVTAAVEHAFVSPAAGLPPVAGPLLWRFGEQVRATWPSSHPLPLPEWDERVAPELCLDDNAAFGRMISDVEALLQQVLEQHNYNTVGNFIQFYKSFKATNCTRLADYFQHYLPPITAAHHSCVGLALELRRNIEKHAGPIASYFYIVSCEESIGAFEEYPCLYKSLYETRDILEKEHVLLALRFMLQGRAGILLLDPGYHVARAIVVMKDNLYPHTGWFTQSKEPHLKKQYNYSFSNINDDFVQWSERVSRNKNCVQEAHSVIYIRKPYLTSVDVTERRNLVYSFRSWLSRDGKGHLIAGVYFKIAEADDQFTLFYHDSDSKLRIKLNFSQFAQPQMINDQLYTLIEKCNDQLHLSPGQLLLSFEMMNNIMKDKAYLQQLLDINNAINIMTES